MSGSWIQKARRVLRRHRDPASVPRYEYKPLSLDNHEIRTLHISPGKFNDDIYVQLSHIDFNPQDNRKYKYEALSYTWGSADAPIYIFVLHDEDIYSIPVTQSCALALRYLRFKDQPRTVWIDAICIDQEDLAERSRQVSIMRSIYKMALRVVVWLGPASNDSDLAIRWADEVASEINFDYTTKRLEPSPLSVKLQRLESRHVLASENEVEAFAILLERPYFDRLWVWQEVRSGGANVILACGDHETTFHAIMTAVAYCFQKTMQLSDRTLRLKQRVRSIAQMPVVGDTSPLLALDRVRDCHCHDPRDRIYTCFAFSDAFTALEVTPDYTLSTARVYIDFILTWVHVEKNSKFLMFVGDEIPHEDEIGVAGLPSWVPDWSMRNTAMRRVLGFCSGNSQASGVLVDQGQLICPGLRVGIIQRTVRFGHDILTDVSAPEFRENITRNLKELLPQPHQRNLSEQLLRVLTSDEFAEHYVPQGHHLATMAECEHFLLHLLGEPPFPFPEADLNQVGRSFMYMTGRSVFLTESRQIGLGPRDTRSGDLIVLLLGCPSLLVVRQPSGVAGPYRVIGSAWCTGHLDGEGILGPLPDGYETVQVLDKRFGGYNPGFRNKITGDVTYEDPRLPAMPPEWEVDESRNFLSWRNRRTQEWRPYTYDPRMDADALESRGIKLEEFCLV